MKYIKNNLDYSVKFKTGNGEEELAFDCRRIYSDTGNVATTGITPIDEADYDRLYKELKVFKDFVDSGKLALTKKSEANSVASKIDDLAKENETLKKQLAKKTQEANEGDSAKIKEAETKASELNKENESLKKQLEALKKKQTTKKTDDTEGF